MSSQASALTAAILAARQANPGAYANVASNYLIGAAQSGKITGGISTLQAIANTGTFNITTNSGNYNIQSTSSGLNAVPIQNTLSGIVSKFLSPGLPSTTGSNVPGTTAGPNTQTVFTPATTSTDSLTTSFNSGLTQIKTVLENHPEALLLGGAIVAFLLLRK